ncbi:hypothetical protein Tco_0893761 [Tanacetum coccineum]|uniref:Uncharacterized protein n=1 Tax=Tanacetum coccineum TaxID=301880 RepID=A0ABQ5CB96_9ASTR
MVRIRRGQIDRFEVTSPCPKHYPHDEHVRFSTSHPTFLVDVVRAIDPGGRISSHCYTKPIDSLKETGITAPNPLSEDRTLLRNCPPGAIINRHCHSCYRHGGGNPLTSEVAPYLAKGGAMGSLVRKRCRERGSDGAKHKCAAQGVEETTLSSALTECFQSPPGMCLHEIKTSICREFKIRGNPTSVGHPGGSPEMPPGYKREHCESVERDMSNADFFGPIQHKLGPSIGCGSQLRMRFEQEVRLLKKARAQIARRDQRIQVREDEIKRLDQEIQSLRTVEEEVHGLLSNLQAQVTGEEKIKAAFEDFKTYEDDKVEQRCAEMDARLDALKKFPQALQALCERLNKYVQKKQEEKNIAEEHAAKYSSQYWKPPIYYDNDDDEEYSIQVSEFFKKSPIAITPVLLTIEPEDSLSMGDEHLSTIPEKESDKVIKSSVENLGPIPNDIVSIPPGKEIDHLDAIPDSVQSLLNRANSIIFLIEEFAGELAPIDPIPPGNVEADFDPEEDIRLIEKLLNDDLSPHSLRELNYEIPNAIIKSFSPSPIPVEDSDSLMEEIDIFLAPDDSIPPSIENDDYDSERDVLFLEELLNDDSISLPEYESFHVDFYNVPSSTCPPEKPQDDDVYFDIEPNTGVLTTKVVDDISDNSTRELYVHVPNVLPTLPTIYLVFDTLLPFSSENEDKNFNPRIHISKEEKSPHLLSHRGFKVFSLINDSESPMMIYGGEIPILDVLYLYFYPP